MTTVDLRQAINAVSDVVQNRPRPLREFDQIYMKTGDMVLQSELIASWAKNKRIAFIGDGDAISVCIAYLQGREVLDFGPSQITVFDFDERIVQAVKRFADAEQLHHLTAQLYNCFDPFPDYAAFDCFYTNPPWGAYNNGESAIVFLQRGMEALHFSGDGVIVIADDEELAWPREVLANVQKYVCDRGFFVSRLQPKLHSYHLDDAPELQSCNLFISSLPTVQSGRVQSQAITDPRRLENFYGRSKAPRVRYIREKKRLDYGKAHDDEYKLELLETLHD